MSRTTTTTTTNKFYFFFVFLMRCTELVCSAYLVVAMMTLHAQKHYWNATGVRSNLPHSLLTRTYDDTQSHFLLNLNPDSISRGVCPQSEAK